MSCDCHVSDVGRETGVHGRLEAAHVFHGKVVCVARFQVFVQDGEDLVVENLELANSIHHSLQWLQKPKKKKSANS